MSSERYHVRLLKWKDGACICILYLYLSDVFTTESSKKGQSIEDKTAKQRYKNIPNYKHRQIIAQNNKRKTQDDQP